MIEQVKTENRATLAEINALEVMEDMTQAEVYAFLENTIKIMPRVPFEYIDTNTL